MSETIYTKDVVANIQAVAEQLKDEGCDAEAQTLREAAEYIAITDSGLQNVLATLDVVRAEAAAALSRADALREALERIRTLANDDTGPATEYDALQQIEAIAIASLG